MRRREATGLEGERANSGNGPVCTVEMPEASSKGDEDGRCRLSRNLQRQFGALSQSSEKSQIPVWMDLKAPCRPP